MGLVSFEFKDKEFIRVESIVKTIEPSLDRAKVGGLFSIGNFYRQEARQKIEGFRTDISLSQDYRKKYTRGKKLSGDPFKKRILKHRKPFGFLARLVRFRVFSRSNLVVLGFGTQDNRFDRELLKIGSFMQSGYEIDVTQKMRRAIALTEGIFLKKSTTKLKVPARPVFSEIIKGSDSRAAKVFRDKVMKSFNQNMKKLAG